MAADGDSHKSEHRDCDTPDTERPLDEQAAAAARAELRGERTGILGALGEAQPLGLARARQVPDRWSLVQVLSHWN